MRVCYKRGRILCALTSEWPQLNSLAPPLPLHLGIQFSCRWGLASAKADGKSLARICLGAAQFVGGADKDKRAALNFGRSCKHSCRYCITGNRLEARRRVLQTRRQNRQAIAEALAERWEYSIGDEYYDVDVDSESEYFSEDWRGPQSEAEAGSVEFEPWRWQGEENWPGQEQEEEDASEQLASQGDSEQGADHEQAPPPLRASA